MTLSNKTNLKKSLNLPKTSFSMKANLTQNEPLTLKRWKKENTYDSINASTSNNPPFIFHDGPPYANGSIHIGHLLNKVLKDLVVRSQQKLGNHCPYIPGWDCHGLPIEHRVMTEIIKHSFPENQTESEKHLMIRKECQSYAKTHIKRQSKQMEALLTLADYKHPYLTMTKSYEAATLNVFSKLVAEGIVYRALKPVHWSLENKTALAEAELEYQDREDPAIYLGFPCTDKIKLKTPHTPYFLIWTTTPWTIPANRGIAINKSELYSIISNDTHTFICAKKRVSDIEAGCHTKFKIHGEIKGSELLGLHYTHPFTSHTGSIHHAEFVTMEDGSGLVHIAPGHGQDDYLLGKAENLPIYCPVKDNGIYDATVPDWLIGQSIWDANQLIINRLKESGHLLHTYTYQHSYPHDWRSKTPVIFRSTEQWFVSVDTPTKSYTKSLREMALSEIESSITFIPSWGKNRLHGMLESRPDWCLSRQRSWGLPIPAFRNDATVLLTEMSIKAVAKKFETEGSDYWFKSSPADILSDYDPNSDPDAPKGLNKENLEKMNDIFDVWFESGSSWHAVLESRNIGYPADLYLEGSDQHRGWFHLSLLPSLAIHGRSPFKKVLTHGFIVDKDGKKMSKSMGNALDVDDILKEFGAEVMRWWVSGLSFENDIKVDKSFFEEAGDGYRKIRNTLRFLLSNIYDYERSPDDRDIVMKQLGRISDKGLNHFILSAFSSCQNKTQEAYKQLNFKLAHQLLYKFCNDTLSSFYCSAVKDRLYCDKPDSMRRRETQQTLWMILDGLLHLLHPILPHTTEECYHHLYSDNDKLYLNTPPIMAFKLNNHWDTILRIRSDVLKKLEAEKSNGLDNPLDTEVRIPHSNDLLAFKDELSDILGVSRVELSQTITSIEINDLREEPRCERSWRRDKTVRMRESGVMLSDRDDFAIKN